MRKLLIVVVVLAILGAAGYFGYQEFQRRQAEASKPEYEAVNVERGDISATISATGAVLPEREVNLAFAAAGAISEVSARIGEAVKEGEVLAALDTTDLELAVRQAEVGLAQAEAQLQQLNEGPSAADVAAAEAGLVSAQQALKSAQQTLKSAQANYQQTLKGPDRDTLAASRAQVDQARVQLQQAQQAYDRVKDRPDVGMLPQSVQLQNATIALETAEAQYRAAEKSVTGAQVEAARSQVTGAESQVTAAEAQIAQAQANLDRLGRGASEGQRAVARAGVDQAMLALQQAQRRLEQTKLLAPWDGVVTAVTIVEGGQATPGQPAVRLADASQFHLDAQVDEVDIAGIEVGQTVQIEVDALPDEALTGKVSRLSPSAVTSQTGGVTYNVRLDIDPTEAPLLSGMSATATIIATTRNGVLLVPNRAIQLERETGRTYVEKVVGENLERVEVQLGLRDEQFSEIREGVNEGDTLAIRSRSSEDQLRDLFGGGGM
ncbi:MAG: efflux RND transporter periplasmic adaptor subunit [Anaerolineae bacterium]|jgi:HlyD family secretion protein|nr:efflux RND transporter periplasmic adaptor subunit [Anaerolineae bacterium]